MTQVIRHTLKVLLPVWIIQIILAAILLVAGAVTYVSGFNASYSLARADMWSLSVGFGLLAAWTGLTIVLDVVELVLYCVIHLHPVFLLLSCILKFIIWWWYLAVSIQYAVKNGGTSAWIIIPIFTALVALVAFIYAVVTTHKWRRARKGGAHYHASTYDNYDNRHAAYDPALQKPGVAF